MNAWDQAEERIDELLKPPTLPAKFKDWPALIVEQLGPRRWRVVSDFVWRRATIPTGFITDAASIPRFLWGWTRPEGIFPAAVVHDYRYQSAGLPGAYQKEQADEELFHNIWALGYRESKAHLIWWGPRIGGRGIWEKHKRANKEILRLRDYVQRMKDAPQRRPGALGAVVSGKPKGKGKL